MVVELASAGPVVLAGDAVLLRTHLDRRETIADDVDLAKQSMDHLLAIVGGDASRILPGHDPQVSAQLAGMVYE